MSKRKSSSRVRRRERGSNSSINSINSSNYDVDATPHLIKDVISNVPSFDLLSPAPSASSTSLSSSASSLGSFNDITSTPPTSTSSILVTTQKSNNDSTKSVNRRVRFSKKKQIREISCIRDQAEIDAIWWNDYDYDEFGENNYKMVQRMKSPRTYRALLEMDHNGCEEDSPRGLEFHLPEAATKRMNIRYDAATDVLREQQLQRQEGIYDDVLISNCYRLHSVRCVERALKIGLRDARVALNQEKQDRGVPRTPSGRRQRMSLSNMMEENSPSRSGSGRIGRRSSLTSASSGNSYDGNESMTSWQSSPVTNNSSYGQLPPPSPRRADYRKQRERFLRANQQLPPKQKKSSSSSSSGSSTTGRSSRARAGRRGSLLASGAPRTPTPPAKGTVGGGRRSSRRSSIV